MRPKLLIGYRREMNIFGLTIERAKPPTKAAEQYPSWLLQTAEAERFQLPDPSIYGNQADLYKRLSWVAQAIDVVASSAAIVDFEVARIVPGREPKDIPNHPFEQLLNHPNALDSRFEFLYATVAMWKLNGNAYWWLNRSNPNIPPDELWFIPPHMIQPIPDGQSYIKGYYYYPGDGQELILDPSEIVHFRRFNPFSRFVGLSAVESIAMTAIGDLGMAAWNTRLFAENNARLPGILTFEQMIEDGTWKKIKDDTREASKKRELLMLRGVGQGGVQWIQNAVSQKEMEFLAGRQANKEEIFGVLAPGAYSMLSNNATEANSRTGRAALNELTIYPMLMMMSEKITTAILPSYGGRLLTGHFEDVRISDRQLELTEQIEFSKSHTLAEIREEFYGDEPLGDERDNLLLAQVGQSSGATPQPVDTEPAQVDQPAMQSEAETIKNALDKFERFSLRNVGKSVDFINADIPDEIKRKIKDELSGCKSAEEVTAVFARYREAAPTDKNAAVKMLAASINRAVEAANG